MRFSFKIALVLVLALSCALGLVAIIMGLNQLSFPYISDSYHDISPCRCELLSSYDKNKLVNIGKETSICLFVSLNNSNLFFRAFGQFSSSELLGCAVTRNGDAISGLLFPVSMSLMQYRDERNLVRSKFWTALISLVCVASMLAASSLVFLLGGVGAVRAAWARRRKNQRIEQRQRVISLLMASVLKEQENCPMASLDMFTIERIINLSRDE